MADGGVPRRRVLLTRLGTVVAVAIAALAIVLVPGVRDGDTSRTPHVVTGSASEENRPTLETVQRLAAKLNAAKGDQPITAEQLAGVVTAPGEYQALGHLSIPAIDLEVEVGNGVDPVTLEQGPGHWTGTPVPGQVGNAVISGHRTTHTAPFLRLDELAEGDEITTTSASGATTTYVVDEVVVVPVADYTDVVLAQPDDPTATELTLFACHPEGSLTHRIVVHASAA